MGCRSRVNPSPAARSFPFLAVFIDTVVAYEFAVTFTSGQLLTKLLLVPGLNLVPIVAHEL